MADQVVQEIKDKLDIAEVIGSYMQLKRAGVNWKANCPFHGEKTPSFNVNPTRQIWHCFGCGEGGDVFTFVQKYEHLDFPETLKLLADRAGVPLPERRPQDSVQKDLHERLHRINTFAAKYYNQLLLSQSGATALAYLTGRGLTSDTIGAWGIGYASDEYQALEKMLLSKGAKKEDLVLAGVSAQSTRGTYDRFRGRITFPIFDFAGKIVGFSARILEGDQVAKYINTPESPVYRKGQVLFGLYQAKKAIRETDYAVIVEGQMDCIKAHQAGFNNTVAPCGTALTLDQLRLISKLTRNLKLSFDGDVAGQKAAKKAGILALGMGFSVKLVRTPRDKDPDDLLSDDPRLWEAALKNSVWFVEHYIQEAEQAYPARSVEQRKFVTQEIVPLLKLVADSLERDHYIGLLTERLGFSKATINELVQTGQPANVIESDREAVDRENPVGSSSEALVPPIEKAVLGVFLIQPPLLGEWLAMGGQSKDFSSPEARLLTEQLSQNQTNAVLASALAQEALFMVESEKTNADGNEAVFLLELHKTMYAFRLTTLKNQQQQVTANIRQAEIGTNTSLLRDLQREFAELAVVRLALERKIESF